MMYLYNYAKRMYGIGQEDKYKDDYPSQKRNSRITFDTREALYMPPKMGGFGR